MASITLQKANFWKRISAWLLDFILLTIVATGFAVVVSYFTGYDAVTTAYNEKQTIYEEQYGIDFDITQETYDALSEADKAYFDETYPIAVDAFQKDVETQKLTEMLYNLILIITGISLFFSCLILYFIVPLFFGHGQTLGKKIFGLAVMRTNCVKASNPVLFIRSMIGLYAMETMFPTMLIIMFLFGVLGLAALIVLVLLLVLEIGVMIGTKTNSSIHDLLTDTVVIDFASQEIFDTEADMIARKQQLHEEEVAQSEYDRIQLPSKETVDEK